jgi:hypothetical protein
MKVNKSFIHIVGTMWMPSTTGALVLNITSLDADYLKDDNGNITRESVEEWLSTHSGDFRNVIDFYADIETDSGNVIIDWLNEENEIVFNDCTYPEEY